MTTQLLISAFGLGLLSSFHCVGMCGAIAFSLPTQQLKGGQRTAGILLYNFGRISLYALMGLLFGLLGRQLYIAGFQQWFSIVAGIVILLIVVQVLFSFRLRLLSFQSLNKFVQKQMCRFLQKPRIGDMFLLGAANGLLPCGMVYFAITGALASGTISNAVLFMLLFGMGTFPAMFSVSFFGYQLKISWRVTIKKAMPFMMAVMGMLLILRGMGLGIPYISPFVPGAPKEAIVCH